jgi:hypothetical protein
MAVLGVSAVAGSGRAESADEKAARADFSGTWALNEQLSEDPIDKLGKEGLASGGDTGGRPGGSGGAGGSGALAVPWELLEDNRRFVLEDSGLRVRVTRAKGRQRVLFLDGEERELDDGDGPAKVTAKRKGARGEKILVSVKWSTGRERDETWEILSGPRRLAVTTKVKDRRSISVRRVYEPGSAEPEEAASTSPPTPAPTTAAAASPASPAAAAPAGMSQCSLRPPKGTSQDDLSRLARVSREDAVNRATAFVAPGRPTSVISSDVEVQEGCLVWSFILRFADKPGAREVVIDAGDGKVLAAE